MHQATKPEEPLNVFKALEEKGLIRQEADEYGGQRTIISPLFMHELELYFKKKRENEKK